MYNKEAQDQPIYLISYIGNQLDSALLFLFFIFYSFEHKLNFTRWCMSAQPCNLIWSSNLDGINS